MRRQGLTPSRLEAISDGVIAVIITIMVLELKVPGPDGLAGLRAVLPTIFLYLLTFVQIGIYWVNHHYLVDEAETVTHGILWANLVFSFLSVAFSVRYGLDRREGAFVVHRCTLCRSEHFPGAGLHGDLDSDTAAERRARARELGQADRIGFAVSGCRARGLREALGLAHADRDRFSAVASAAQDLCRASGEIRRGMGPHSFVVWVSH